MNSPVRGLIPVKSTLLGDLPPETVEERDARIAQHKSEWPTRMVSRLTPEQRKEVKKLLLKKNKLHNPVGSPLKWDERELVQLRRFYRYFKEQGRGNAGSIEALAAHYSITPKTISTLLTRANKLP